MGTGATLCLMAGLLLAPLPAGANGVEVSVDAPATVAPGDYFTADIDISAVTLFDSANFDVMFDTGVLEIENPASDVTDGQIDTTAVPVSIANPIAGGVTVVVNIPGYTGVTGEGYLCQIRFHAIGASGTSSDINLQNGVLSSAEIPPQEIPATWIGTTVNVVLLDTTAPTVVDKSPTGSNVPIDTLVTATFSEAMAPATIDETSFTLVGSTVSGTVSYDAGTFKATFTPDDDLEYNHEYTATLSTDITDLADNPLAAPYSWSFTTVRPAGWGDCGPIDLVIVAVNNLAAGTRDDSAGNSGTQIGDFTEAYRDDALKIVVLITDAPPGGFNDVWDDEDTEAMHTHALTAKDNDIMISDIYVPTGGVDAGVAALLEDDAETSGGIYTEAESSGAGVGDAIKDIIDMCGARLNAEFRGTPRRGAAPLRVRFTDESTGPVESWLWDFGDGRTSSQQNPTHVYPNPGTYDVSLEVSGAGDTDEETKVNYIVVLAPEAVAAVAPEPGKIGASYLYISPEQIVPSQWVEISANIYNRGGTKASHTVALLINGYLADSQTVGVSPGGTELVVFRVRADSEFLGGIYTGPGEYIANVEGMEGQFFVLAPAEAAPAGIGGPLGTAGIIAIVVVVIVLIVGLVFGLKRE